MTETAEKLKSRLSRLSIQERAELAHFLIQSLGEESGSDTEADWDNELARRVEEIESEKAIAEPAEKVINELRKKYS